MTFRRDTLQLCSTFPGREAVAIFCADIGESNSCNSNRSHALAQYRYCRSGIASERSVRDSASLAKVCQPVL
jgi:hypothetical protein